MPALYTHDRFGAQVYQKLEGGLREIIGKYYTQFEIGLQGPDIFFFYRPYGRNRVSLYGHEMHSASAMGFFKKAVETVKQAGRDTPEYAYLLGFVCHFILDSECHPYVSLMIRETGVQHLEIEEEFEKYLLRLDGEDALAYPLAKLVPTDADTARAIAPFYEAITPAIVRTSLYYMKLVKRIFYAPGACKRGLLNGLLHLTGRYEKMKGLMLQKTDHPGCIQSNQGLEQRFDAAVPLAVKMIGNLDEAVRLGRALDKRFDRNFK